MQGDRRAGLIGYALIFLAILVQLQATLPFGGTEVRVNAADIALAALAPIILFSLYKNFASLKAIAGPHMPVLVVVASALLSYSLYRGYGAMSGLSIWAAVKYSGWYILFYYLITGALIAIMAGEGGKERFALGFIGFQVAVILAFIAFAITGYDWPVNEGGRLTGFAGNTNAMAFYFICGFALALAYTSRDGLSLRRQMAVQMAAGAILAGILFTKSVAALIAIICVILFAAVIRVTTLKRLLQVLALGLAFWAAPQIISESRSMVANIAYKLFGVVVAGTSADPADLGRYNGTVLVRMEGYREAVAMWRANPVFGAGLGTQLYRQGLEGKPKNYILQIHNTGLWLLAETGLAGFLAMAGIFAVLFHKVWSLARSPPHDQEVWFASAVVLLLAGWAVMALFHELMYQRVVWLLVGMALTAPVEPLRFWKRSPGRKK